MKYFCLLFVLFFVGCGTSTNNPNTPKTDPTTDIITPSNTDKNEKRYALVIGNAAYNGKGVNPLTNPANDADLVSASLKDVQFEVIKITNADRSTMWDAIDKFVQKLSTEPSSVGLFYYAGHGLEIGGTNYLLPTDVKVSSNNPESDVSRDAYKLQELITRLENARNRMNMIFLDACRDNPFPSLKRSIGSRGMTTVNTTAEIFVGYSTSAGATAGDGDNTKNSPFSLAFATLIKQQKDVSTVYKDITAQVVQTTNSAQRPWSGGSLTREFYFVRAQEKPIVVPAPVVQPIVKPVLPEQKQPVVNVPANEPKKGMPRIDKPKLISEPSTMTDWHNGFKGVGVGNPPKWGIIDRKRNIIIPLIYEEASTFYYGLAGVKQKGKWGFVNMENQVIIPFLYDDIEGGFQNGMQGVKKNNKWGFINLKGQVIIPFEFDFTHAIHDEGLIPVGKNNKIGFINFKGETVIPFQYDNYFGLEGAFAGVKKDGKQFGIDKTGKCVKNCPN